MALSEDVKRQLADRDGTTLNLRYLEGADANVLAAAMAHMPLLTKVDLHFRSVWSNDIEALTRLFEASSNIYEVTLHFDQVFGQRSNRNLAACIERLVSPSRKLHLLTGRLEPEILGDFAELKRRGVPVELDLHSTKRGKIRWLADIAKNTADQDISDAIYAEAFAEKALLDRGIARKIRPGMTTLEYFCLEEGVPLNMAQHMIEHARREDARGKSIADIELFAARLAADKQAAYAPAVPQRKQDIIQVQKDKEALKDSVPFPQAVEMVAKAFDAFDEKMGNIVREAYKQGRMYLGPSYGAHTGIISNQSSNMPKGLQYLVNTQEGMPYVSIPLEQESFTLANLFTLAHECGHLVSKQRRYEQQGKRPVKTPLTVAELYSGIGERLFYNYMMAECGHDVTQAYAIEKLWHKRLRTRLVESPRYGAVRADFEDAMDSIEYRHSFLGGSRLGAPELEDIAHGTFPAVNCLWQDNKFLNQLPFYHLSYPLGMAASEAIVDQWEHVPDREKRDIVKYLEHIQRHGTAFNGITERFGLNMSDALSHAEADLEQHTAHLANMLRQMKRQKGGAITPADSKPHPGSIPAKNGNGINPLSA